MHESAIARRFLSAVLDRARLEGEPAVAVRHIRGWIADAEALSADSIAFHFGVLSAGTMAAGARLELEVRRIDARCRACGDTYWPDHHVTLCPACGSADGELLGDTGVGIESIDVELEVSR
jgi:hydrogenase nickel incorporation protein HypA/HybF